MKPIEQPTDLQLSRPINPIACAILCKHARYERRSFYGGKF